MPCLQRVEQPRRDGRPRASPRRVRRRPPRRRPAGRSAPLASVPEPDVPRRPSGSASWTGSSAAGIVVGSIVLVGGEPGIGKSTLLLQAAAGACASGDATVLYATGEESAAQVRLRATDSGCSRARPATRIRVAAEREVGRIAELARAERPTLVIVDSIQTVDRRRARRARRQRRPGARVRAATGGAREVRVDRGRARRPRDQGRLARRPEDPRAPRRRGARARGRALLAAPDRPRLEEPVRIDRGGGRVRDGQRRSRRR